MKAYLGVDGGGTRTQSLLVRTDGTILGRGLAGPSNPQHTHAAELSETLHHVVSQASPPAAGNSLECAAACFGLAGASSPIAQRTLTSIIDRLSIRSSHGYRLQTDARIALTGAFAGAPGCLLILGTGSVCLGLDADGSIHRTGGWGSIADDAGSAGWIGRKAIETAVRQADGRIEGDAIQKAVFSELAIESVEAIIPRLHAEPMKWRQIAALCPRVLELAERGDAPAHQIVEGAVHEASALIRATRQKLHEADSRVAVAGGLPEANPFFYDWLCTAVARDPIPIQIQRPQMPAVAGAVLEAHKLHRGQIYPEFLGRLRAGLEHERDR